MLEANGLHKSYHNGAKSIHVLKGIDLKIEKGDFLAVTGPSGSGKSTLLHILGGLDTPSGGRVFFKGEDLYQLADKAICQIRNKNIGFVFQFYHLLPEFTVLENVLMPALINCKLPACRTGRQIANCKLKERAMALLADVGLAERANHFPSELSGGEKQRAAMVRALINAPEVLLCDEPTGNLDARSGNEIIALIKKINQQNQMAVVLVTHNLELAKAADRIYQLRDGILVN